MLIVLGLLFTLIFVGCLYVGEFIKWFFKPGKGINKND